MSHSHRTRSGIGLKPCGRSLRSFVRRASLDGRAIPPDRGSFRLNGHIMLTLLLSKLGFQSNKTGPGLDDDMLRRLSARCYDDKKNSETIVDGDADDAIVRSK